MGAGLIGGSVALALRGQSWHVSVVDQDETVTEEAVRIGAADTVGFDRSSELVVVAAPVGAVPDLAHHALARSEAVVTDVGSTKADICKAIDHPRFIGGHPLAGSEQDGLSGATAELFTGAMWVLTPEERTDEAAFAMVRAVVRSFGAETIALPPHLHDQMVAQVSHVPHLTAATLMNLADAGAVEHRALLRLAAGGFRDMTRISAGRASIWPDICVANAPAIVEGLDALVEQLRLIRDMVDRSDREGILELLSRARAARLNLPVGFAPTDNLVQLAVPIPDRPGEIAAISTLAAELDVNIYDLELSHSGEGRRGVMVVVVDETRSERFLGGLIARGYRPTMRPLQ
jgi:prephenate dehydrogenase